MATFSGAIKIADGLEDYLSPSQNCIVPLMKTGEQSSAKLGENDSLSSVGLEMALENASNMINANGNRKKIIAIEDEVPTQSRLSVEGGHFAQIRDTERNTATITLNDCLACSGCVTSAETILISQQSGSEFLSVMKSIQEKTSPFSTAVVSLSPQSCESLAILFNVSHEVIIQKLHTFFHSLGVDVILDTSVGIDIALLESQHEFVSRLKTRAVNFGVVLPNQTSSISSVNENQILPVVHNLDHDQVNNDQPTIKFATNSLQSTVLPLLASECPGWVCFAEKTQGEKALQYMSSVRSPQQIMGAIVKRRVSQELDIPPAEIYHVSLMPCYDKKLEASRDDFFSPQDGSKDVDLVLSTIELSDILIGNESLLDEDAKNVIVKQASNPRIEAFFTEIGIPSKVGEKVSENLLPFSQSSLLQDASCLTSAPVTRPLSFNASGNSNGYAEANFRYAAQTLFGVHLINSSLALPWLPGSNPDLRAISLEYIVKSDYRTFVDSIDQTTGLVECITMDSIRKTYPAEFVQSIEDGCEVGIYAIYGKDKNYILPGYSFTTPPSPTHPCFAMNSKYKIWKAKAPSLTSKTTGTKVIGTCLLWIGLAYGFRNIQNIIRQGLPSSPNYHYVEIMACPSGCLNGGGQIRAIDIPMLRENILALSKKYENEFLAQSVSCVMQYSDNMSESNAVTRSDADSFSFTSVKSSTFNAGSSLKAQKELVQLLEKRQEALPIRAQWNSDRMIKLYQTYFGGSVGSEISLDLFHTSFRSVESTVVAVVPKW